jgi:hypothetical protein
MEKALHLVAIARRHFGAVPGGDNLRSRASGKGRCGFIKIKGIHRVSPPSFVHLPRYPPMALRGLFMDSAINPA